MTTLIKRIWKAGSGTLLISIPVKVAQKLQLHENDYIEITINKKINTQKPPEKPKQETTPTIDDWRII